ncbi:MAG: peptidoglycan DD-metalloendopeptidase family protein [Elusimicrobiota bacterium]
MEKKLIFAVFSIVFLLPLCLSSQKMYNEKKAKLENIKLQIDQKNKELEEYMEKYEKIFMDIKKLKNNEKGITEKKEKLNLALEKIKSEINNAKLKYESLKKSYAEMIDEMNNDISSLYLSGLSNSYFYGKDQMILDIIKRNMIMYKSAFVKSIDQKRNFFSKSITKLSTDKNKYSQQAHILEKELVDNKKQMKDSEKKLIEADAKLKKLRFEIDELNKTASELNNLIRKIEKNSPYKKNTSGFLPLSRKSLPWPVVGTVIRKFGKEYVDELKTWLVNDGIKIKPATRVDVKAVMSGKVVYSGAFRGFGNVVIIDHENNIYTTYGFLSDIYVNNGAVVNEDTIIGKTGIDPRNIEGMQEDVLYFEVRNGEDALNPLDYLK